MRGGVRARRPVRARRARAGRAERVAAHLATCPEPHRRDRRARRGRAGAGDAVDEVDAPAELKRASLESYDRYAMAAATARQLPAPAPPCDPRLRQRERTGRAVADRRSAACAARLRLAQWLGWAAAARGRARPGRGRRLGARHPAARQLGRRSVPRRWPRRSTSWPQPGSICRGPAGQRSGRRRGGFAAFSPDGERLHRPGQRARGAGRQTYQAWYIVDGLPASAGMMSADADGFVIAEACRPMAGHGRDGDDARAGRRLGGADERSDRRRRDGQRGLRLRRRGQRRDARHFHHPRGTRRRRQEPPGRGARRAPARPRTRRRADTRAGRHHARRARPHAAARDSSDEHDPVVRRAALQRRAQPPRQRGHPAGSRARRGRRLRSLRRLDARLPGLRRRRCRSTSLRGIDRARDRRPCADVERC